MKSIARICPNLYEDTPRGAATLLPDGKTLRREFASGTVVTLDTSTQLFSGRIEWGEVHGDRQ